MPSDRLSAEDRAKLERATADFLAAQELNADRPEARATLGNLHTRRGETAEAEAEFQAALRLAQPTGRQPQVSPTSTASSDATDAESVLRKALAASPRDAGLHHAPASRW
jgi:Flp pilus assembly protein TadD